MSKAKALDMGTERWERGIGRLCAFVCFALAACQLELGLHVGSGPHGPAQSVRDLFTGESEAVPGIRTTAPHSRNKRLQM